MDHISWALSGRDTVMEDQPGPAMWRSDAVLERSPDLGLLNEAGTRLAIAVLVAELRTSTSYSEIVAAVTAEIPDYGTHQNHELLAATPVPGPIGSGSKFCIESIGTSSTRGPTNITRCRPTPATFTFAGRDHFAGF